MLDPPLVYGSFHSILDRCEEAPACGAHGAGSHDERARENGPAVRRRKRICGARPFLAVLIRTVFRLH